MNMINVTERERHRWLRQQKEYAESAVGRLNAATGKGDDRGDETGDETPRVTHRQASNHQRAELVA